jgi:hypothetical protein
MEKKTINDSKDAFLSTHWISNSKMNLFKNHNIFHSSPNHQIYHESRLFTYLVGSGPFGPFTSPFYLKKKFQSNLSLH